MFMRDDETSSNKQNVLMNFHNQNHNLSMMSTTCCCMCMCCCMDALGGSGTDMLR